MPPKPMMRAARLPGDEVRTYATREELHRALREYVRAKIREKFALARGFDVDDRIAEAELEAIVRYYGAWETWDAGINASRALGQKVIPLKRARRAAR